MKILDVELKTGLTRANIRFYEKEKLISIARNENGYRNYTDENVDTLLKIKLLRQLKIPIEEIRKLQQDEVELQKVLHQQMQYLNAEIKELEYSHEICEHIYTEGSSYKELNALKYLNELANKQKEPKENALGTPAELEHDVIITPPHPWLRFFARCADYTFYIFILHIFYYLIAGNKPNFSRSFHFMIFITSTIMMVIVEPILLSTFRTTLGKWLFGISVTEEEGGNLSYHDAFWRTIRMIQYGQGYYIPIYHLYCYWCCRQDLRKNQQLPWDDEYDCQYHFRDTKIIRRIAYIILSVAILFGEVSMLVYAELPRNKGNISLEEFAENYNDYLEYYNDNFHMADDYDDYCLDSNGLWRTKDSYNPAYFNSGVVEISYYTDTLPFPRFTYVEQQGILKEISLEYETIAKKNRELYGNYTTEITLAILSYACAQPGMGRNEMNEIVENVIAKLTDGDADFTYSIKNIDISCKIEDNCPDSYSVSFSMKSNDTTKS